MHICKWPNKNCKKCIFFNNLRAITHEENMEAGQMTTFYSPTFSALFVTFISEFESTQYLFSSGVWYVEYLNI